MLMQAKYTRLMCLLTLVFVGMNVAALHAGRGQPEHPALRGFVTDCEAKPQPCWYGIVPGATTVAETQRILTGMGYTPTRRSSYGIITYGVQEGIIACNVQATYRESTSTIRALRFRDCTGIRYGDFGTSFGIPDRLLVDLNHTTLIYERKRNLILEGRRLSPYNALAHFELLTDSVSWMGIVEWRGHIVRGLYCREQLMRYGHQGC